jgi:hypothetical protein
MRLPSPALVVACLALLLGAGGVAYGTVKATGNAVNIVDGTNAAYLAKVSSSGELVTSGNARPLAPTKPFNFAAISFTDGGFTGQFAPTTATLALTGIRVANSTGNATNITIYQYMGTGSGCFSATGTSRFLGQWMVPAGQTLVEPLTTPLVLKPATAGQPWCLATYASGSGGYGFYITYNGYVVSGTFASAALEAAGPTLGVPVPSR